MQGEAVCGFSGRAAFEVGSVPELVLALETLVKIPATLLLLDPRDRAGLTWIRNRARFWLTALKRRRKYLPPGEPYSDAEAAAIMALVDLEEAASRLLGQEEPGAGQAAGPL